MAEYIEREATLKEAESRIMWGASATAVYEAIQEAPAADVEPVRHGRWMNKGSLSCRCSECGCKSNKETQWCPNCGAKMDG